MQNVQPVGGGERDAALVVAIGDYDVLSPIEGATTSGLEWEQYFSEVLKVPHVQRVANSHATRSAIISRLKSVRDKVQPGGRLWFVFIGHGAPGKDGRDGMLLAADARPTYESIQRRSLSHNKLAEILQQAAGPAIALLDACYSGLDQKGKSLLGNQPVHVVTIKQVKGVAVYSAARNDQPAGPLPGAWPRRPAFSYLMLGGLLGWGDAWGNNDGQVSGLEALAFSRAMLARFALGEQIQEPQAQGDALHDPLATRATTIELSITVEGRRLVLSQTHTAKITAREATPLARPKAADGTLAILSGAAFEPGRDPAGSTPNGSGLLLSLMGSYQLFGSNAYAAAQGTYGFGATVHGPTWELHTRVLTLTTSVGYRLRFHSLQVRPELGAGLHLAHLSGAVSDETASPLVAAGLSALYAKHSLTVGAQARYLTVLNSDMHDLVTLMGLLGVVF